MEMQKKLILSRFLPGRFKLEYCGYSRIFSVINTIRKRWVHFFGASCMQFKWPSKITQTNKQNVCVKSVHMSVNNTN